MSKSRYDLPVVVNGQQILETVSFWRAAYINRVLEDLEKNKLEAVHSKLEEASKRMQALIDEIKEIAERQNRPYP